MPDGVQVSRDEQQAHRRTASSNAAGSDAAGLHHWSLTRLQGVAGNQAVAGLIAQRYTNKTVKDGRKYRISDDKGIAVQQEQDEGGQDLSATRELMVSANAALLAAGSAIELVQGDPSFEWKVGSKTLIDVRPSIRDLSADPSDAPEQEKLKSMNRSGKEQKPDSEGELGSMLALWTDCGRASRVVTGGMVAAVYTKGDISFKSRRSTDPAVFSNTLYSSVIVPFMESDASTPYLKEGVHYQVDDKDPNHWLLLAPVDADQARRMYWELGDKGRAIFDKYASINAHANPEIGGTYTMVTESSMPGYAKSGFTWNFHWAGVLMKDGGDNLTLEGYAVMASDEEIAEAKKKYSGDALKQKLKEIREKYAKWINRAWVLQMYGTKVEEQTFHHQHLESGTHGNRGTTFAAKNQ